MEAQSEGRLDVNEESVTSNRQQTIFDARDATAEIRREAKLAQVSDEKAATAFRAQLEEYVLEAQSTLYSDGGKQLWSQRDFGTTRIRPPGQPASMRGYEWQLPDGTRLKTRPNGAIVLHQGLTSLFDQGDPLQAVVEYPVNRGRFGNGTESVPVSGQIDWGVLDQMYLALNRHVKEAGLDLDPAEGEKWDI